MGLLGLKELEMRQPSNLAARKLNNNLEAVRATLHGKEKEEVDVLVLQLLAYPYQYLTSTGREKKILLSTFPSWDSLVSRYAWRMTLVNWII